MGITKDFELSGYNVGSGIREAKIRRLRGLTRTEFSLVDSEDC